MKASTRLTLSPLSGLRVGSAGIFAGLLLFLHAPSARGEISGAFGAVRDWMDVFELILILLFALALIGSWGFRRLILRALRQLWAAVLGSKDAAIIAESLRQEEINRLTEGFNRSLAQMQERSEEMRASEQRFREMAEAIGAVFWMSDLKKHTIIYVSRGYERTWGRSCESLYAAPRQWLEAIHPEDRERVTAALPDQGRGKYDVEYRVVRPDGGVRWVRDRAFPVRNEAGEVYRVAGIAEDISDRKELEQQIIEISDREQRRLGLDLHDGICQELVSVAFASDLLRKDLLVRSPHDGVRLAHIIGLLDNAIMRARKLSQALYPVNLVGNGLGFALRELASGFTQGRQLVCGAECADTVSLRDHAQATHLYRIAQEAVQNAVKCGEPSRILISLSQSGETIYLSITDDGAPIDTETGCIGLSIMKYRAAMAGGRLEVQRGPLGENIISVIVPVRISKSGTERVISAESATEVETGGPVATAFNGEQINA